MKVKTFLSKTASLITVFSMTFGVAFAEIESISVAEDVKQDSSIVSKEEVKVEESTEVKVEENTKEEVSEEAIFDESKTEESTSSEEGEVLGAEKVLAPAPDSEVLGSITVCKAIAKKVGEDVMIANANEVPNYTFTIPWVGKPGTPGTQIFNDQTPIATDAVFTTNGFTPERNYFGEENDSDCETFNDLPLGSYFYGEEEISGGAGNVNWTTKYSDQVLVPVDAFNDVDEYNDNLFTSGFDTTYVGGNKDADGVIFNTNADGHIVLNKSNAGRNRTIVVLNIFEEIPLSCEADVNLVTNGGFEYPVVNNPPNGWDIYGNGTPGLGWNVEWRSSFAGAPAVAKLELHGGVNGWLSDEGSQHAELDTDWGYNEGEEASVIISQYIPTIPGQTYELSYAFSPRPGTYEEENILRVKIDGGGAGTHGPIAGGANTLWTPYTVNFVATSSSTKISFEDAAYPNSVGTFLDDVKVRCFDDIVGDGGHGDPGLQDPQNETQSSTSGSSSSSGSRRSGGGGGSVLGASTEGDVLGACVGFTEYHKKGDVGGEVSKIQEFLNQEVNAGLTVNGVYDEATAKAVGLFQEKYSEQILNPWFPFFKKKPTHRWYKTTKMMANEIIDCPEESVFLEDPKIMYKVKWDGNKTQEEVKSTQ